MLSVAVRTGDAVKSGQELARLDTTALDLAVKTAQVSLDTARLKMQQLLAAALPSDVASAEQSVLSASGSLQTALASLTNAQTTLDGLQGRATAASQQTAVQQQIDALNAQHSQAQKDIAKVIDTITATSGSATGLRGAIDDLNAGVSTRCNDVGNRDACASIAANATTTRQLISDLDGKTRVFPSSLAPSVDWFERQAGSQLAALQDPAAGIAEAAAADSRQQFIVRHAFVAQCGGVDMAITQQDACIGFGQPLGEAGVQLCQHQCPVVDVAREFPVICEAETAAIGAVLGRHVTRLATLAHGDQVCTTVIPLMTPAIGRASA